MSKRFRRRRDVSYYIITTLLIGSISIGAGVTLYYIVGDYLTHQKEVRKKIYGHWVEQNVAPYLSDTYTIKPDGIYRDGRVLTTDFRFNGSELIFTSGGVEHEFVITSESFHQMKRIRPEHYESIFLNTSAIVPLKLIN